MNQVSLFDVRIDRNVRIPMPDGVSLAADLHLPDAEGPFPTLVTIYPYHKDGQIGIILENARRYLARRGYACLMVDLRGTGGSSGLPWEMGDPNEYVDGAEVVEWAARQPWSDGNVGMWGGSYGGILTLGTAALNPPHLKAISPQVTATNLYEQAIFVGGCLNGKTLCGGMAGAMMLASNLTPPLNADPKGQWHKVWVERIDKFLPYGFAWQEHPTFDEYWRSRVIPIDKIEIPAFLVASWRDFFPEPMMQIYQRLSGPKRIIVGPWKHGMADMPGPEPVDYVFEMWRWWERWLKGKEDDAVDEPPMRIFVQGSNVWRHEREWPIPRTEARTLFLSNGEELTLRAPREGGSDRYKAIPSVGAEAGSWAILAAPLPRPLNQAADDLLSVTYMSDPLEEDVEITGAPEVVLHLALERGEDAILVARLNDVGPDGSSTNIATGHLKASHYRSHAQPERLQPGQVYQMQIRLAPTSYLVPNGHRLRFSLSCSDFPHIFPTPTNPEVRVYFGGDRASSLRIPVVPPATEPLPTPHVPRPEPGIATGFSVIPGPLTWKVERDFVAGTVSVTSGAVITYALPNGGTMRDDNTRKAVVCDARPDSARLDTKCVVDINMPTGHFIQVEATGLITEKTTLLVGKVKVDGQVFFEKKWTR